MEAIFSGSRPKLNTHARQVRLGDSKVPGILNPKSKFRAERRDVF